MDEKLPGVLGGEAVPPDAGAPPVDPPAAPMEPVLEGGAAHGIA